MNIEVTRYRKADGYLTRYWSVMVNGELLAVTLYRKGAEAVKDVITGLIPNTHAPILEDSPNPEDRPATPAKGKTTYHAGRPVRNHHSRPAMTTESEGPRNQQETPRNQQGAPRPAQDQRSKDDPKDAHHSGEPVSQSLNHPVEPLHLLPEPESARKKRRRKGLMRKILGDCPF
jgi:hypothetical protein